MLLNEEINQKSLTNFATGLGPALEILLFQHFAFAWRYIKKPERRKPASKSPTTYKQKLAIVRSLITRNLDHNSKCHLPVDD